MSSQKKSKEQYISPTGSAVYVADRIVVKNLTTEDGQIIRYNAIEKDYQVNMYDMIQSNESKCINNVSTPMYGDFTDDYYEDSHEAEEMMTSILKAEQEALAKLKEEEEKRASASADVPDSNGDTK